MEDKYNSKISRGGTNISGGQKQGYPLQEQSQKIQKSIFLMIHLVL